MLTILAMGGLITFDASAGMTAAHRF